MKETLINDLFANVGNIVTREQIFSYATKHGITNPGFLTKTKVSRGVYDISGFLSSPMVMTDNVERTEEEIISEQRMLFKTLDRMTGRMIMGGVRSLVVSGSPGIGKTHNIQLALANAKESGQIQFKQLKGETRATGIYRALYNNRMKNNILSIDDTDSVFDDEVSMNILKAALDSSPRREISWGSEKIFKDEFGNILPNNFLYEGSVIFATNKDLYRLAGSNKAMGVHLKALCDRSYYIDMHFRTNRELIIRIKDVLSNSDMGLGLGLKKGDVDTIIKFIDRHQSKIQNISLRMVEKLAGILKTSVNVQEFEEDAIVTCLKRN
jgi:hypothetical protein